MTDHPKSWTENADEIKRLRAENRELAASLALAAEDSTGRDEIERDLTGALREFCRRVSPPDGDGDERNVGAAFGERMQMTYRQARAAIAKAQP